jgi:hypothetical protein
MIMLAKGRGFAKQTGHGIEPASVLILLVCVKHLAEHKKRFLPGSVVIAIPHTPPS